MRGTFNKFFQVLWVMTVFIVFKFYIAVWRDRFDNKGAFESGFETLFFIDQPVKPFHPL